MECNVDIEFREGYIAILEKMKFYLPVNINKANYYVDRLTFQGSNDGTTFTDLYVADDLVHTGWNYVEWRNADSMPKYKMYRFKSNRRGGCIINEIQLYGQETIDDETTMKDCAPKLFVNGVNTALTGFVQY